MNFWENKKTQISDYYENLYRKYGACAQASDYGSRESQQIKFDVLASIMPLNEKKILDVGCGFATYYEYLSKRYQNFKYTGFDLTRVCIESALKRNPSIDLRVADILRSEINERYDVVTANGIFYLLGEHAESVMFELIDKMFSLASEAVAFNSLSYWCENKEPNEFYADPLRVLKFCKSLTPWVTFRHDYHPRDFTIYMYKVVRR